MGEKQASWRLIQPTVPTHHLVVGLVCPEQGGEVGRLRVGEVLLVKRLRLVLVMLSSPPERPFYLHILAPADGHGGPNWPPAFNILVSDALQTEILQILIFHCSLF